MRDEEPGAGEPPAVVCPRRVRRWVRFVLFCLLLGFVSTVSMVALTQAAGHAMIVTPRAKPDVRDVEGAYSMRVYIQNGLWSRRYLVTGEAKITRSTDAELRARVRARLPGWVQISEVNMTPGDADVSTAYGWPFDVVYRCSLEISRSGATTVTHSNTLQFGSGQSAVLIATGVIPLGLAADFLFYSGVWGVLLWLPGVVRRRFRERARLAAGRCKGCGYPREGLDPASPCPECGIAPQLRSQSRA